MKQQLLELLTSWCVQEELSEQSALRDMLTDIRLLADDLDVDYHRAERESYPQYLEEKKCNPAKA